ncbi:MAG: TetR/AcrR family transcriptional regulator [Burkholderiaceae bacterium]
MTSRAGRSGGGRAHSRLPQVLDAAAAQFAAKGYQAATIRGIVESVGMLPGSLYCHFANKDELLAAVYAEGVRHITRAVQAAADARTDPWDRLEAACEAHLETLLDASAYAKVLTSVLPSDAAAVAPALVALRDGYERVFARYVADLPLPPNAPRRTLRMMLLGALNWTTTWYRAGGGRTPRRLARDFVGLLRAGLATGAERDGDARRAPCPPRVASGASGLKADGSVPSRAGSPAGSRAARAP